MLVVGPEGNGLRAPNWFLLLIIGAALKDVQSLSALDVSSPQHGRWHTTGSTDMATECDRRAFLTTSATAAGVASLPKPAQATESLADRLASRDASKLSNSIFNRPPDAQIYPPFMRSATWDVESQFSGYLFPSTKIPKEKLVNKATIPGFQKCSIAAISDIGKEGIVSYGMRILENGLEDRTYTLQNQINAFLGYQAVSEVIYDPKSNPNRISIDFVDYKTINAERIELFCNGRESELYVNSNNKNVFVCSEFIRQVTFGGGTEVGIPRQVVTNYAHFWTWSASKNNGDGDGDSSTDVLTGNLLTAAYLDAQDPSFFDEPLKPVAVYSHVLKTTRRRV